MLRRSRLEESHSGVAEKYCSSEEMEGLRAELNNLEVWPWVLEVALPVVVRF